MELAQKLLSRITVVESSGCWEWNGTINKYGYAYSYHKGLHTGVHRLSYLAFKGEIPTGHYVCHTCDNRKCINPDHLFTGTQYDNMQDAIRKGRLAKGERLSIFQRGEKSNSAKLTWPEVRDIRASEMSTKALARKYKVRPSTIYQVRYHKTWIER